MKKLRQIYLGYLSLFLLLFSTIGWGQIVFLTDESKIIDITNNDAYYKTSNTTDPSIKTGHYLIADNGSAPTKLVNNLRKSTGGYPNMIGLGSTNISTIATNYVVSDYLPTNIKYIRTPLGGGVYRFEIEKRSDNKYSLYNTNEQMYLYNYYLFGFTGFYYINSFDDDDNGRNSGYVYSFDLKYNKVKNNATRFTENFLSSRSDYFEFRNESDSNVNLYRRLRLDEFTTHAAYVGSQKVYNLKSDDDNTDIKYKIISQTPTVPGEVVANINNNIVDFLNEGEISIEAIVAQNGSIPSYKKTIKIIVEDKNYCFNEEFQSNIGENSSTTEYNITNTKFEAKYGHVYKITSGIKLGNNDSDQKGKIITKPLNLTGTIKVELDVKARNIGEKLRIGFVKDTDDNQNFLIYHDVTINANLEGNYETVSYTFENIKSDYRLKIDTQPNNKRVWINNIRVNCEYVDDFTYWYNNRWSNGDPDKGRRVELRQDYDGNIYAKELTINLTAPYTGKITIKPNKYYRVVDKLIVNNDQLEVSKGGYLLLEENTIVTGNVKFKTEINQYKFDTRVVSSPVKVVNNGNSSGHLITGLMSSSAFHKTNNQINGVNDNVDLLKFNPNTNSWIAYGSNAFTEGIGVGILHRNGIEYKKANPNNIPRNLKRDFIGNPNNNSEYIINVSLPTVPGRQGKYLLGNPYSAPLNIEKFLRDNQEIVDYIELWKNDNYYDFTDGYYMTDDYWIECKLGENCTNSLSTKTIDMGVGFVVTLKDGVTSNNIKINHSQKSFAVAGSNDIFYNNRGQVNKSRFIISLKKDNIEQNNILVSYNSEASDDYDEDYDLEVNELSSSSISILNNNRNYIIDSRAYPLNEDDNVKLNLIIENDGIFSISLKDLDGDFKNYNNIFLKDNFTNRLIDLKINREYIFESLSGEYNNRFEIVFKQNLNVVENIISSDILIYKSHNDYYLKSKEIIESYMILDINGRKIEEINNVNSVLVKLGKLNNGIYIYKVLTKDGKSFEKKVVI